MAAKSDYYDILGVSKGSSDSEIKTAYRKQAVEWHPDKHKDDKEAAERRFKEINEAYQVLSDIEKRKAYDQFGHNAFSPGGAPGGAGGFPGGAGGWKVYTSGSGQNPYSGFDFGDPFDIFEQFFGGRNPFAQQVRKPRYSLTIEFMEAIKGVEKEVSIEGSKKKIRIPPGVDDGSRINFNDFILSINVKPHDTFEREGADILVKLAIPFSLVALGGAIDVPTVDGDVKLKIRKGTQPGMMRLRGKGAPRIRGRGRGDQYIRLNVAIPEKLTKEQKKMVEKMKKKGL